MKAWSSLEQPTSQRLWISMFTSVSLAIACANVWLQHTFPNVMFTPSLHSFLVNNKEWTSEVLFNAVTRIYEFVCWLIFSFSALIRPGRFDMQVTVPKPDVKGRTEILNWYLKKIKVDPGVWSHLLRLNLATRFLHTLVWWSWLTDHTGTEYCFFFFFNLTS